MPSRQPLVRQATRLIYDPSIHLSIVSFERTNSLADHPAPTDLDDGVDTTVTRAIDHPDHPAVGDTVAISKRLTDGNVHAFAQILGDSNPLHLDDAYAEQTRFGGRIVHGILLQGLVSATVARLPGCPILLTTDAEYQRPVAVGEVCTAVVRIVEALGTGRYRLETCVETSDGSTAISGEALVLLEEQPEMDGKSP